MNKRRFVIVCSLLLIAIIASYLYLNLKEKANYTDRYGFTHNASGSVSSYVEDENISRDYALVTLNKDEIKEMSQHAFIDKITPILSNYQDKKYTTIVFNDGTGIMFPFSSIKYVAAYGYIDESGNVTEELGTIEISGTQAIYKEVNASVSSKTAAIYDYIPEKFLNDDLAACIDDNGLYIAIGYTADDKEAANQVINEFITSFRKYDTSKVKDFKIVLNYTYGFDVNPRTYSIREDDEIAPMVLNKVGLL